MVEVAPGTIAIFSDIGCPWAYASDGFWRPTIVRDDPSASDDLLRRAAATS